MVSIFPLPQTTHFFKRINVKNVVKIVKKIQTFNGCNYSFNRSIQIQFLLCADEILKKIEVFEC